MNGGLSADLAVFITRDGMGSADEALRRTLVSKWLQLILQNDSLPGAICFYAEGVKLVVEGSPVLAELEAMEERGVHLIVCKTCLDFYELADKVRVGVVGGMGDIIAAQLSAQRIVNL